MGKTRTLHWCLVAPFFTFSLSLVSCDAAEPADDNLSKSAAVPIAAAAKADSLPPYRLGMSLTEAIGAHPRVTWHAPFVDECIRDMALKSCFLSISDSNGAFLIEGMNLSPELEFNQFGRLRRVQLSYNRRNDINKDDCLRLAGRLLDHIEKSFGPLTVMSRPENHSDVSAGWRRLQYKTQAGSTLAYGLGPDGTFILTPAFGGYGVPRQIQKPADIKEIHVSIAGYFITVDSLPICRISYELSDGMEDEATDLG